jgi:NAD(P)-dependent dehydrogenase (short-subunit alcohol dehydrogenase family)
MGLLDGKVAVITGSGAGIGRAIAERYVEEGARVCVVDVVEERARQVADALGDSAIPVRADVGAWKDNQRAIEHTIQAFGKLDIFVGNAGVFDGGVALSAIDGDRLDLAFDELFGVNVKGCLLGIRAALDYLKSTHGSVIVTASYASFAPAGGGVLYTASKHALLGLVRQLAYELAPWVRVNGVAPGVAPTRLRGLTSLGQGTLDSVLPGTEAILPLGRIPATDDYAGIYAMLASPEVTGMVTGHVVVADSGLLVRGFGSSASQRVKGVGS